MAYRKGGHRINVVLLWCMFGLICYAITNAPGTSHDYKLASAPGSMLDMQKSTVANPNLLAAVWDSGFLPAMCSGEDAEGNPVPASFRPYKDGDDLPEDPVEAAKYLAFSRWVTCRRQIAEWGNNMLQRGFLRLLVPVHLKYRDRFDKYMRTCIYLHNFRTRLAGYNQAQTLFRRLVDEDFRAALLKSKLEGGVNGVHMYLANPGLNMGTTKVLGVELPLGYPERKCNVAGCQRPMSSCNTHKAQRDAIAKGNKLAKKAKKVAKVKAMTK